MGVLERALRQLRWSVDTRGVGGTAALVVRRLAGRDPGAKQVIAAVHPFDTEYGLDTGGRINGSHLGGGHAHDLYNVAYQGTPPSRLERAVQLWEETLPAGRRRGEYAFFDVGCGKGRVVMLASQMGFREVGGVELDPGLAQTAQKNLEIWAKTGKARCGVEVSLGDATEVRLPALPCVVYLYNPFRGPVVRKLLERLDHYAGEQAGLLDVIYVMPNHAEEFAAVPRFKKVWEGGVRMSEEDRRWDASAVEDAAQIWRR